MGQKNQLWWDLPAVETFILNKEIYEISNQEFDRTLAELIALLSIKDIINRPVRKLSLGQRMKCELVAALIHKPKVLFLDEPTVGLDVVAQKNIRDFIKKYNHEKKTTIILTSHYMQDIKELCKRVIIIDHGQIIYDGKLLDLTRQYAPYKLLKVIFTEEIPKNDLIKYSEIYKFKLNQVAFKVKLNEVKNIATQILNSELPVDDILIEEPEVDDIIREIFTKKD